MELAYGRTIHKFQGQSAGPVDDGKIKNQYEAIICDPDEHKYEGKFMGLFYTALSRATTLGSENGLKSAIYFTGLEFREDRFRNLGKQKGSVDDFVPIQKRTRWVQHLKNNTVAVQELDDTMKENLVWAQTTKINGDKLYDRITEYLIANRNRNACTFGNLRY